jgi:hypothetical protein
VFYNHLVNFEFVLAKFEQNLYIIELGFMNAIGGKLRLVVNCWNRDENSYRKWEFDEMK